MKSLFFAAILLIFASLMTHSADTDERYSAPVEVINTVCDDPHVRYVCPDCDSTEFYDFVESAPSLEEISQ